MMSAPTYSTRTTSTDPRLVGAGYDVERSLGVRDRDMDIQVCWDRLGTVECDAIAACGAVRNAGYSTAQRPRHKRCLFDDGVGWY